MIKSNAILEVNKLQLINNFKILSKFANKTIIGATIKGNAYGFGDKEVFKILYNNGCRHFFLATLEEAVSIRKKYSKGNLYALNGLENHNFEDFNKYKTIPILVSNTSSLKEINGNVAEYFNPDDINEIKEKLIKFYSKPKLNEKIINEYKEHLKKFSWQENLQKTLDIIKEN